MELMKFFKRGLLGGALLGAGVILSACQSDQPSTGPTMDNPLGITNAGPTDPQALGGSNGIVLRVGDELDVTFFDIQEFPTPIVDQIKEDGTITLIQGQQFQAAGKTVNELRADIQKRYVPDFYKTITFTVVPPKRTFSVGGEVNAKGSIQWPGYMDLVTAINQAGGLTEFANHHKIQVTRANGKKSTHDFDKAAVNPAVNPLIFPGDTIYVPRRLI